MATAVSDPPARSAIDPRQHLMQIAGGSLLPACLYVAAKLNIADLVASGPRPVDVLAASTKTHADALYRVLRALVSVGVFSEPAPRTIGLSPAAELLRTDVPGSVRDMVLWMAHPLAMHVTSDLMYSVETGRPAVEHLYQKSAFECFASMPEVFGAFNAGMTAISKELAPAVLEAYDFSDIGALMDVAGGHGYFICQALRKYPRMKGMLLDLPHVVEGAKCTLCDMRVDDRCQPIAGDMFEHIPPGADAYFMQHIIHDWDDERALKLLGNVRQALDGRNGGRLIVVDSVLPQNSLPHRSKLIDLRMLLMPGGRERTEPEWRALFAQAGLTITQIVPTEAAESVIEAVPT